MLDNYIGTHTLSMNEKEASNGMHNLTLILHHLLLTTYIYHISFSLSLLYKLKFLFYDI